MDKILKKQIDAFIKEKLFDEILILCTGSLAIKDIHKNSDIDLLILTNQIHYPYTRKQKYLEIDFHTKIVPLSKVSEFMVMERASESPVLCDMITKGKVLVDKYRQAESLKKFAVHLMNLGPLELMPERKQRYLRDISRNLDVLRRELPLYQKNFVIADLITLSSSFILLNNKRWSYSPKKRFEQLMKFSPNLVKQFEKSVSNIYQSGSCEDFIQLIESNHDFNQTNVHHYTSKFVNEIEADFENNISIYTVGIENITIFLSVASNILERLQGDFQSFYFCHLEDVTSSVGQLYFLNLIKVKTAQLDEKLYSKFSLLKEISPNIELVYPDNQGRFVHEQIYHEKGSFEIHTLISNYIKTELVDNNIIALLNFKIIKLLCLLPEALNIPVSEYVRLLNGLSDFWLPASVDYANCFNVQQILRRKIEIKTLYRKHIENYLAAKSFLNNIDENEIKLCEIIAFIKALCKSLTHPPLSFQRYLPEMATVNEQYLVSLILKSFLIPDQQKAYLLNVTAEAVKKLQNRKHN